MNQKTTPRLSTAARAVGPLGFRSALEERDAMLAFSEFAQRRTVTNAFIFMWFTVAGVLLYWPFDYLNNEGSPHTLEAVFLWRYIVLGVNLSTQLLLYFSTFARRHALPVIVLTCMVQIAGLFGPLALIGGLESPFFYSCYMSPLVSLALVVPLAQRIVFASLICACAPLAFFAVGPQHFASLNTSTALATLVFSIAGNIGAGHVIFVLIRRSYLRRHALTLRTADLQRQEQRLAELNSELEHQNDILEERVEEQLIELRRLANHLENSREDERARLARELHDDLGQSLTALRLALDRQSAQVEGTSLDLAVRLKRFSSDVDHMLSGVRRLVADMRPQVLDDLGLVPALEWLTETMAERAGVPIDLAVEPAALEAPPDISVAFYRICQESLVNALKHAKASRITVTVCDDARGYSLAVADDGIGIPGTYLAGGGVLSMRERLRVLHGKLIIERTSPGTRILAVVPAAATKKSGVSS